MPIHRQFGSEVSLTHLLELEDEELITTTRNTEKPTFGSRSYPTLKTSFASMPNLRVAQEAPKVVTKKETGGDDYWNWSSENDTEINKIVDEERFSADHIVDNILRQPAVSPSTTCASNDQYWDWSHAKKESTDYWNWPANEQNQSRIESDSYWAW